MTLTAHRFTALLLALSAGATAASAQEANVFSSDSVRWVTTTQAECMRLGERSVRKALGNNGLDLDVFSQGGWRLIVEGPVNLVVYCIADDGTDALYSRSAERVLATVSVTAANEDLARSLRNIVADCMEGAPCFADEIAGEPHPIEWYHSAAYLDAPNGTRLSFICPPIGEDGMAAIWGTDVYTTDSAICVAAVHAGVFDDEEGGLATLEILGPQQAFTSSERNGVETLSSGGSFVSYRIVPPGE